jgi:choline-glycine betaine transporter
MTMNVFWDAAPYSLVQLTDVSEALTASVTKAIALKCLSVYTRLDGTKSHKTVFIIVAVRNLNLTKHHMLLHLILCLPRTLLSLRALVNMVLLYCTYLLEFSLCMLFLNRLNFYNINSCFYYAFYSSLFYITFLKLLGAPI